MRLWRSFGVSYGCLGLLSVLMSLSSPAATPPSTAVFDFTGPVDTEGVPTPWVLKSKSGEARLNIVNDGQTKVLHLSCQNASFAVERSVEVDVQRTPMLTWSWKAVQLPPRGDVRASATNDQALQLLLAFDGKKVLSYIWDTQAPVSTVADESLGWPISVTLKVLVVQSGNDAVGRWLTMTRNVLADYRQLFGQEPRLLKGIRVQSNCQNTAASAAGSMGPIRLELVSHNP